ncbi:MAG: hypothetical protein U9R42_15000 [Bacteroidota bacterium]|nr:hypothetical protein [Bacteroidota bacterium]
MKKSKGKNEKQLLEIPEEFFSFSKNAPFTNCLVCNKELRKNSVTYFIEKAIKKYIEFDTEDVIFEYAICMDCAMTMQKSFSKKSLLKIFKYMTSHAKLMRRRKKLEGNESIEARISECMIKGIPKEELSEYQIAAQCIGDKIIISEFPYLISGEAMDEISNLISNKTLDQMDRFKNKYFTPPVELEDLFKDKKLMFV